MTLEDLGLVGVKQTLLGRGPDFDEPCGNCMAAALATVLGRRIEEVPHFLENGPMDGWWDRMNAWLLEQHGVALLATVAGDWDVPPVLHLMQGRTVRGSEHVVVGFAGQMIFDPHPNDDGLTQVQNIELFVAKAPVRGQLP